MVRRLNDTEALTSIPLGRMPAQVMCERDERGTMLNVPCFTSEPMGSELSPPMPREAAVCGDEGFGGAMRALKGGRS